MFLEIFELAAKHLADLELRAVAGYITFSTHARLRCADGDSVAGIDLPLDSELMAALDVFDDKFLEAVSSGTKTGRSKEKKTSLLPIVPPRCGILVPDWFGCFIRTRSELGLPAMATLAGAEAAAESETRNF